MGVGVQAVYGKAYAAWVLEGCLNNLDAFDLGSTV